MSEIAKNTRLRLRVTLPSGHVVGIWCIDSLTSDDWLALSELCEVQGKSRAHYITIAGVSIGVSKDTIDALLDDAKIAQSKDV